ncbi:MAG TPA: cystathionine beta-lyase, partial [Sphingopyxis terrae]|nr:cystathionine beta-lyase [Sphingopyxis terrae]
MHEQDPASPRERAEPAGGAWQDPTRAVHAGPRASDQRGLINPPVDRASTIIYDSV